MNQNVMMKRFSDNLLMLMGKNDYSTSYVAKSVGIDPHTLNGYIGAKHVPSVYVACRMADLFGVPVETLVGWR
jgi:DNA-binding XRE family transcriptional regulator